MRKKRNAYRDMVTDHGGERPVEEIGWKRWAFVNTVMNVRVPEDAGHLPSILRKCQNQPLNP